MARPKAAMPSLRYHISGQAVVSIGGRDFYLGKRGTASSAAKYAVLIGLYQSGGLKLPDDFDESVLEERSQLLNPLIPASLTATHQGDEPILVQHVTAAYRGHVKKRYANEKAESHRLNQICDELDRHFGTRAADTFGPRALQDQRQRWIDSGNSRVYCNRLTNCIVRIYKWAVAQELIEESTWTRLKSVEPLRCGQTEAPETTPVVPVSLEHVRATAKLLSPVIKTMLRVHVATGMRPSELCSMRPCDIDQSGVEWVYRPPKHKNANKGKARAIPIVGDARFALEAYMDRDPQCYCFSPAESMAWYRAKMRAERKGYGSYKKLVEQPAKEPRDHYDSGSYRQSIQRAAKTAKVPSWHPYQIRHMTATMVRAAFDSPDFSQALLGHSNVSMTEHYAKVSENKAIEAARLAPTL